MRVNTPLFYHKQLKKDGRRGPHHWRTRKDSFEKVTDEIDQLMIIDPHRSAASVLRELIKQHPHQFRSGHVRSVCNVESLSGVDATLSG